MFHAADAAELATACADALTTAGPACPSSTSIPDEVQYRSVSAHRRVGGVARGLGPVLVVCTFDVPFGVFAFDDAGVASTVGRFRRAASRRAKVSQLRWAASGS